MESYGTNKIHIRVGLNIHMTFTLSSGTYMIFTELYSQDIRCLTEWRLYILIIKYLSQWIISYMTVEIFIIICSNRLSISVSFGDFIEIWILICTNLFIFCSETFMSVLKLVIGYILLWFIFFVTSINWE